MLIQLKSAIKSFLNSPLRVLVYCLLGFASAVIFDGSFFRLWSLHHENSRLSENIERLEKESFVLDQKIHHAKSLEFIERQARDQLDLVEQNELVFVFASEEDS
ncbi:MAG: septum formation initiator family protein [Bdellovibrionales bacterium]